MISDIVDRLFEEASINSRPSDHGGRNRQRCLRQLGAGDRIGCVASEFEVKRRKRGIKRNPKTGVEVAIPGKSIRFKPGKELRHMRDEKAPGSASRSGVSRPSDTRFHDALRDSFAEP
jgi:hypothetical protein